MVSIIVPVYNVEKYLNECVESVLKLKSDIEIILVDDGSTDTSGAICDAWAEKEPRVRVIHQKNGGLSAARNTGIENAQGEYVMFLDSDDFLDSQETERMLAQLKSDTQVLMGLYRNYYAESSRTEKEDCDGFLQCCGKTNIDDFLKVLPADGTSCYMVAVRFIVCREVLVQNNLFFTQGIYHEDEEWTQRLLCSADNITVTHNYFYQYRQAREGAITSSVKPKHVWDIFIIMEHSEQLLHRQQPGSAKAIYLKNRMAQLFLSNMIGIRILAPQDKKAAYAKLSKYRDICANHMAGTIGTCARICLKVLGLRATCLALHIVRRVLKGTQ